MFSQPSRTHGSTFDKENNFEQPWSWVFLGVWRMFCQKKNILQRITKTLKHILKASCEAWYVKYHCITQFCCTCVFRNNNRRRHWKSFRVSVFFFLTGTSRDYFPIHPGRLTWNLQITHLERKMIFQTSMSLFHVNLPGCSTTCLSSVFCKKITLKLTVRTWK